MKRKFKAKTKGKIGPSDYGSPRRKVELRKKPAFVNLEDQFDLPIGEPRASKWWDLFKDGINNSGLALFLTCKHQFYLRYVCGYDVPQYADAIEFGNVFHWLIEQWHRGQFCHPHGEGELEALKEVYHPEWLKTQVGLSPANKQTQEGFYYIAAAMFPFYRDKYRDDLLQPKAKVEEEFKVKHYLSDGTPINLYGTIDLHYGKKELTVVDHKTSSWITPGEVEARLGLDLQLMFYGYALLLKTGNPTAAVYHDIIRRTTSKKHAKEDFKTYAKRIAADVRSRPTHYFVRCPAEVGPVKQAAYNARVLAPMLEDLASWARGESPHYPNPNALIGRYGPCRLFGPITSGNFGGLKRRRPTTRGVEI